jgi:HK97 family phage prohead protease
MTVDLLDPPALLTADAGAMVTWSAGDLTADAGRRQITGRVLTYGTTGTTSLGPTVFDAGSCRASAPANVALLVEHDRNRAVGYGLSLDEHDGGLFATFTVPPGAAGDAALADAASGLRAGLSVGAEVQASTRNGAGALQVSASLLREVSLVAVPAWDTARVTNVAATAPAWPLIPAPAAPAPPTVTPPVQVPAAELVARAPGYTAPVAYAPPASNPAARSVTLSEACRLIEGALSGHLDAGEVARALRRPPTRTEAQGMLTAQLIDVIPSDDAGFGLLPPAWLGELWSASGVSRPLIDAISTKPLPATGTRVYGWGWLVKPTGGPYAGDKADIPSGPVSTGPLSSPLERWAGGNDVDRIFFDRGEPGFVEAYFAGLADDYALDTESILSAKLLAAATAGPPTLSLGGVLADAVLALGGIGATFGFAAVAADLFTAMSGVAAPNAPAASPFGTMSTNATPPGMFVDPSLPAGTVLVGDRRAATFYEARPPIRVQAVNVAQGGLDLAMFGYHATLVSDPRALRKYTGVTAAGIPVLTEAVTPPAAAAASTSSAKS